MPGTEPLPYLGLAGRPVRANMFSSNRAVLGVGVSRRLRFSRLFGAPMRLLWSLAYSGAMPSTRFLAILWQRLSSWPPYTRIQRALLPCSAARFQCNYAATTPCWPQLPREYFLIPVLPRSAAANRGFLPTKGCACCRDFVTFGVLSVIWF